MSGGGAGSSGEEVEELPDEIVRALQKPDAYPEDPSAGQGIEHRQTHISHVFLTKARVYKLRKAVRPGFLDFGRRDARNEDCLREVALNRRLASDVAPVRPRERSFAAATPGKRSANPAGNTS